MLQFPRFFRCWLALGSVLPMPVLAAAGAGLETIQVTASRRAEPAFEVPVAAGIVMRDEIRAAAPQTVMEALRGQPGASLQQTTPGQGIVILRGLKGSEVLHVVDGFRLNDAIFRNAPNQYVALVDSQALERIETVRGPMSTLYGSDAMGGVVQMLTWEPNFDGASWQSQGRVRTTLGTADSSTLSRIEGAMGRDGFALGGGATYQDVNERRVGGGEELPFTRFTARAADARLRTRVGADDELTLSWQYAEQPRTPRYDELTPGYGQATPNSAVYWFEPQRRDFFQLRWRATGRTAAWDSFEAQAGQQVIEDGRRTRDFGSSDEDRERNVDTSRGFSFVAVKVLGDRHHLTGGADVYADDVESSRVRTNLVTGEASARAPRFPDGSTMVQAGVFLADDWTASERLDMLAGARWSYSRTQLTRSGPFAPVTVSDSGLTGNLGASFHAADGLRLVANVGQGFRAPNVFDLGTFGDRPGNRFNVPNPQLDPEHVTTVDAGFKFEGERTSGELIGYHSAYRDKITSVLTGEVTSSGRRVVQSQNAARLTLYGAEFSLRQALTETLAWRMQLTWTRGDERLAGDEYPADRIPPLNGSAGVTWSPTPQWTLEAWANFAGEQDRYSPRDEVDPRIRPGGTPGWSTWNVRASWQATARLHAALQAGNLGDRRYREFGSGLDAAGRGAVLALEWSL